MSDAHKLTSRAKEIAADLRSGLPIPLEVALDAADALIAFDEIAFDIRGAFTCVEWPKSKGNQEALLHVNVDLYERVMRRLYGIHPREDAAK